MISMAAAFIGLTALTACNPLGNYPNPKNFQGFIEQSFTRVSHSPDANGLKSEWEGGEYISIMSAAPDAPDDIYENIASYMALESGVVVNFYCMDEHEPVAPFKAFYPAEIAFGELPSFQEYAPDGPADAPMMAKSPTKYMMFRPICGAIEFKISTTLKDAVARYIKFRTDQSLCGGFIVDDSLKATALGDKHITLDCKSSGVALSGEPKSFWFSVPENSYTNAEITLILKDGRQETIKPSDSPIEVKRAKITTIELN